MKLYYAARTRAARPRWMLEELGVPYEMMRLDMAKGDHKKPEYLQIHPHGSVPALVDGDTPIFESAAICAYLADKYPDRGLAPAPGTKERGLYYQWIFYSMTTLEPPVLDVFLHTVMLPEDQRVAATAEAGRKRAAEVTKVLEQALAGKQYLVGDTFTTADLLVGGMLAWARSMGLLPKDGALETYVQRLTSRPAFARANAD